VNPGIGLVPLSGDRIALPIMGYVRPHKFPRGGHEVLGQPGWAIWKKGRITALVASERGQFSTMAMVLSGRELSLNLKTKHAGEVTVELQDANNTPLPGYTFAEADPIAADCLDARATWHGSPDLTSLAGQTIVLSFRMRAAHLFSFEFVP
jgi:hypothetical protein